MAKCINGPLSYRAALGVTQAKLGEWLAFYTGKATPYTRGTIAVWERVERGVRLPHRYAMTPQPREAYRALLADVVAVASDGHLRLRQRMGPRRWRFQLEADCRACQRPFVLERSNQVHCRRCIGRK